MENVKQIWKETVENLEKVYDRREAENISYILLEEVFGVKKMDVFFVKKKPLDRNRWESYLNRLLQHEPIQYVTGYADFYGRRFKIQPGALIPRSETEELCMLVIEENNREKQRILEVGVGSGCIAITLALETRSEIFGTDVSEEALKIARSNASFLGTDAAFRKADIMKEELFQNNLDILLSNPPYIPLKDKIEMDSNVLKYEPELALFVPNENPLVFYHAIAEKGIRALKKGGTLYFEIHECFGKEIMKLLERLGYSNIAIHQDMQGKDRIICTINSADK